ncbi:MAG: transporter substrate-binding domain-containing protein [Calditrichaeota bacterium]|nr:transporter substrate-binding domain-containing protein [Calditrichota bacterium]
MNPLNSLLPYPLLLLLITGAHGEELVRVGIFPNRPLAYQDEHGRFDGFIVDLVDELARYENWQVQYIPLDYDDCLTALAEGEIDLLPGVAYTPDRPSRFDFGTVGILNNWTHVYLQEGSEIESILDLSGRRIAVMKGDFVRQEFSARLDRFGIIASFQDEPDYAAVLRAVESGNADAGLVNRLYGMENESKFQVRKSGMVCCPTNLHFAVAADRNAHLLAATDNRLKLWLRDRNSPYHRFRSQWLEAMEVRQVTPLWIWWILASLVAIGALFISISRLLSKRVRAMTTELREKNEQLIIEMKAREEAAERERLHQQQLVQADKMASLGLLVSGVAHELNNPNNYILLQTQTLQKIWSGIQPILDQRFSKEGDFRLHGAYYSEVRDQFPQLCANVLDGSRRIKLIVDELRTFARKPIGDGVELVNLNKVVSSSVNLMSNMLRRASQRVELILDESIPKVRGNFQQLEQVVINCLQNACQALSNPDQGITVRTVHLPNGMTSIEISDQGIGIPPENLLHLTDPFFTTKRDIGGTGLGLSISSKILADHRGRLEFDSLPNRGTTVRIILPADETPNSE